MDRRRSLPSGDVTFLLTDVEGSTRLWETESEPMQRALELHDDTLRGTIESYGGYVFSTAGDSFAAAFDGAEAAVVAAVEVQNRLEVLEWPDEARLQVRIGLHTGVAQERGGDYFGSVVNRAARVMAAAHGGQIVVTSTTADLSGRDDLLDLGAHRLSDIPVALELFQVGTATVFPPLRSLEGVDTSLPAQRTALIGREHDLDRVRRMLGEARLVTLTGVGGTGKTRLAIEVAHQELPHHVDGAYFVDLSGTSDADLVVDAFVAGTGLSTEVGEDGVDALVRFLRQRSALLVVDNCEHLIDAVNPLVDRLLDRCGSLRILATSREALGLDGESTFRVPSLEVSVERGTPAAVRLFVERAVASDDTFAVDADVLRTVRHVCERLDGIPLAIELAASRARSMGIVELSTRLDDRFALLTGGRRGARERQRTLHAALEWSHDLLDDAERTVLRRLSVFSGGWTLDAVAPVAGVGPMVAADAIDGLVAKSLVVMTHPSAASVRYSMLETVRHFALDRLLEAGESEACHERHLQYFVELVRSTPFQMGEYSGTSSDVLQPEAANVAAATARARTHGDHTSMVLLGGLGTPALGASLRTSVRSSLDEIAASLAHAELTASERGRVMLIIAAMRLATGQYRSAHEALEEAVASAADPPEQWALTAHMLRLLPQVIRAPSDALEEIDRLLGELVPALPSPDAGAVALAESRSMCLFRLRRYEDAALQTASALASADTAGVTEGHTRRTLECSSVVAAHLVGRTELAAPFVQPASSGAGSSWWHSYLGRIAASLHHADTAGVEAGFVRLAAAARADARTRLPTGDSAYLTTFARLAHLAGDDERAVRFLSVSAEFSPYTAAIGAETLADIADWSDEEFFDRSTADYLERLGSARRSTARTAVPPLLEAEISRWTPAATA